MKEKKLCCAGQIKSFRGPHFARGPYVVHACSNTTDRMVKQWFDNVLQASIAMTFRFGTQATFLFFENIRSNMANRGPLISSLLFFQSRAYKSFFTLYVQVKNAPIVSRSIWTAPLDEEVHLSSAFCVFVKTRERETGVNWKEISCQFELGSSELNKMAMKCEYGISLDKTTFSDKSLEHSIQLDDHFVKRGLRGPSV